MESQNQGWPQGFWTNLAISGPVPGSMSGPQMERALKLAPLEAFGSNVDVNPELMAAAYSGE